MTNQTTTRTVTRFWVVCEGTFTRYFNTLDEARRKAAEFSGMGIDVLRIERQVVTTETTIYALD